MKLLLNVIFILLLILIKIGDAVLFIFNLIVDGCRLVLHLIAIGYRKTIKATKQGIKKTFSFLLSPLKKITPPRFHLSLPKRQEKLRPAVMRRPRPTTTSTGPSFLSMMIIKFKYFVAGWVFSLLFVFIPLLFYIFLQDLPSPKALTTGQIPQTTKIYDKHGTLLHQIYAAQNRTIVPLSDIPKHLQQATIAIEDKDFSKHPGFDITAIIRSAYENFSGRDFQGGSTLTQQLIKSSLLTPETSYNRKIKEVILAFWAERMYNKTQILELYFNLIPYGGTAWGAEAAAQTYFGKSVKDLDLAESAFLAGIPQAPTTYSPFGSNPSLWKKRQKEVLRRMVELGYITKDQAEAAATQELAFQVPQTPLRAPHFVNYVKDYLVRKYGLPMVEKGGLTVITSIDLKTQDVVQDIVRDQVNADAGLNLTNGAAVVTNPKNGDIIAMIGSRDFHYSGFGNVNLATSLRQPGSSIKMLTYTGALMQGFTAATIIDDSPITFPGNPPYSPVNYDSRSHGRVPLRTAFANSYNITAVRTLNQIGVPTFINLGKKMGVKSWGEPENYGLSVTLGAAETTMLEMASIFGTMANAGTRIDPNPLLKVTDYKGNVLEEKGATVVGQKVVDEGVAFIIADILADNGARAAAFGPNSVLNIPGKYVSVKTGTSDYKRDNWTIGYTPSRVVTVWVGNNDNSPMSQSLASGITGAAPIWNKVMTHLLKDMPDERQPMPADVVTKSCQGRTEYFIRGTENTVNCAPIPTHNPQASPTPRR